MKFLCFQVLILLAAESYLVSNVDAANILVMYPLPVKSHWFALKPIFLELTNRGHHITMVTAVVEKDFPASWEVIPVRPILPPSFEGSTVDAAAKSTGTALYDYLLSFGLLACEELLKEEPFQQLTKMKEKKFDLFMMDDFNHNCLLAFPYKLGIPNIALSSFGGFAWTSDAIGDPYPLSYVPDITVDYTDHMNFWQRLTNVWSVSYARYKYFWDFLPKCDEIIRKHFNDPSIPNIATLETRTALVIVQSHPSFSYPRPHLPNVIETGGMHAQKPAKIPKDLESIMDEAKDGIIYFSMGSLVKSSDLPEEKIQAFISVFAKLKQLVLWKWDRDDMKGMPPNVRLSKWYPQLDLLAHKNVQLFISHGGLQSVLEATSRGVPLVGIPVMSEQNYNIRRAMAAGYAVKLEIQNITAQSVEWAVMEVLNNPSYRDNAKLRSRLFHDRPESGVEKAVYWTEYVLRHKGAPHLRSAAVDLTWYQLLLLDVIGFVLLCAVAVGLASYLVIKNIYIKLKGHVSPSLINKNKRTKKE